jgi:hypothetical protein
MICILYSWVVVERVMFPRPSMYRDSKRWKVSTWQSCSSKSMFLQERILSRGWSMFTRYSVWHFCMTFILYARRIMLRLSVRLAGVIYSFPAFFAIFAAIGLKLGVLLYSQRLLFQFAFRCDWFIFARVLPLELSRISDFFQISGLFFAIFATILKLGTLHLVLYWKVAVPISIDWLFTVLRPAQDFFTYMETSP